MRRLALRSLLAAAGAVLVPALALACPTCVSSAFGDRTFNWPYFTLIVMPFAITGTVGVILAYRAGYRVPRLRRPKPSPATDTETT
ncbi:MAG TPA: hypothetical protein VGU22_11255 [Methylomirabilota bacterium]|jgi:hypothetical protein|nr:hypothetical protein [Methylomirabilota bacterium]